MGHSFGFRAAEKRELPARLAPYDRRARDGTPGEWTAGRDLNGWRCDPELVVEVTFDHVSNGRIRHSGKEPCPLAPDKPARECGAGQLQRLGTVYR